MFRFFVSAPLLISFASSLISPVVGTPSSQRSASSPSGSDHPVSASRNLDHHGFGFSHGNNQEYSATIYVNGYPCQVILDTGSSDTWVDPTSVGATEPPDLFYTGINSTTTYEDGTVSSGPIVLANVSFGPYTVQNQAITLAYKASPNPTLFNGLIGLGGGAAGWSRVYNRLENTSFAENGKPILYNLFEHEPSLPNYITMLMSRSEAGITDGGVLTVSEVLDNMTDVLNAPVFQSPVPSRWYTLLDGLYINGQPMNGYSNVSDAFRATYNWTTPVPSGWTVAVLDSGTNYIVAPAQYVQAIYGNIPGAVPIPGQNGTIIYSKLNLTWSFNGGVRYPMHPADVIDVQLVGNGTPLCIGTVYANAPEAAPEFDFILGATFLRNTYQMYDYGSSDSFLAKPSARLLSIIDEEKAWAEADSVLLARMVASLEYYQTTTSQNSTAAALPVYTGSATSVAATMVPDTAVPTSTASVAAQIAGAISEDKNTDPSKPVNLATLTRNTYIILALVAVVAALLLIVIALSVRASRANKGYRAVPVGMGGGKAFEVD
ncbi:acid protease [Trametes coccinea BRFM310]|uniref:Acid protease n=1 Tax=Trametes coccinea (strain BRFM310) TaxID=1353009 RepID=A0A1Y2IF36_TRAC3|nr:acid protease [Trametes coccinea BRFM310]